MAYHPTLTSYQIPFQPLIQTTRQQIQRSLSTLQQKLRRRRQIDIQTQMQLQSQLSKTASLPFHQTYYEALREMEERDRIYSNLAKDQVYRQQAVNDYHHLNRIQELRFERDQLAKENSYARTFTLEKALPIRIPQAVSPSDQQLIRKYENGSKAIQYYKDLQRQEQRGNNIKPSNEQSFKSKLEPQKQLFQTQKKDQAILGLQSAKPKGNSANINTPYDYIKYPIQENRNNKSPQKNEQKAKLAKELQKEFNQIHKNEQKKHVQSILRMPGQITNKRAVSPVKFLNEQSPYNHSMKRYKSLGKMPCNRSKSNLSPVQASILNESYLKTKSIKAEPKLSVKQIQLEAIKKIQNRLKVSKVIYEDSQFRNVKYEGNHLFNKFEMQIKQRSQIRDKINGHPLVLKKHALVVE